MTKRVKYRAIRKGWKLIIIIFIFVLLFRRGIEIRFQRFHVFVCNCSTIVKPTKALFHVISPLGNLVIAYRTNLVVIMPKAFRTCHDQCPVHIRVLAMFTGTFRVKGGERFRASTLCFLTFDFSVVVALLGAFSFNAILRSQFLLLLLLIFHPMNSPHCYSSYRKYFVHCGNLFPFLLNHKPLSIPNAASPSRNVFNARGLVTSLLWGIRSKTY